jgi:hypothetical protein
MPLYFFNLTSFQISMSGYRTCVRTCEMSARQRVQHACGEVGSLPTIQAGRSDLSGNARIAPRQVKVCPPYSDGLFALDLYGLVIALGR